jgi:hypothetical protein
MGTYAWQRIRIIKEKAIIVKDILGMGTNFPRYDDVLDRPIRPR